MADFITSTEILTAAQAFIAALKEDPAAQSPVALFDLVTIYDAADLAKAFKDLHISKQKRLCFLIRGRNAFEHELDGTKLTTAKTQEFSLLLSTTDRRDGKEAMASLDLLVDRIVEELCGEQLGLHWVILEPMDGDLFEVVDDKTPSDSGRKGWFQPFRTRAGVKEKSLLRADQLS